MCGSRAARAASEGTAARPAGVLAAMVIVLVAAACGGTDDEDGASSLPRTSAAAEASTTESVDSVTSTLAATPTTTIGATTSVTVAESSPTTATTAATALAPPPGTDETITDETVIDGDSIGSPPEGVAAVIGYFVGGGDIVSCDVTATPQVTFPYTDDQGTVELGRPLIICASGFSTDEPPTLLVNGTPESDPGPELTIDGETQWFWWWYPPAGTSRGPIDIAIAQGSTDAHATAQAVAAPEREIVVRSGSEIHFYGYPPNETFAVFLYEQVIDGVLDDSASFVAQLPSVTTSSAGDARYDFTTPPDVGQWCVMTEIDLDQTPDGPTCGL